MFEEFSHKYSWFHDTSNNIHYYNGWKINKKVIIPLNGYSWSGNLDYDYKPITKLREIEKVFNYLDGGLTDEINLRYQLRSAEEKHLTKNIELKYFKVTFYKKGTCHITFNKQELIKKFNIFGDFLPPGYGKVKYENMSCKEQEVIDNFEGKESYDNTLANIEYYLYNHSQILSLAS